MEISKMYHKDVSYKLSIDALAKEYIAVNDEYWTRGALPLFSVAHTLAVTMGLTTALVQADLEKAINKLKKAA